MNRDELIAKHVEALVGLGWRWEGRGLVPTWIPAELLVTPLNQTKENDDATR